MEAPGGRAALYPCPWALSRCLEQVWRKRILSPIPSFSTWDRVTQRAVGSCVRPRSKSLRTPTPRPGQFLLQHPRRFVGRKYRCCSLRLSRLGQLGDSCSGCFSGRCRRSRPPTGYHLQVNRRFQQWGFGGVLLDGACLAKSEGLRHPIIPVDGENV